MKKIFNILFYVSLAFCGSNVKAEEKQAQLLSVLMICVDDLNDWIDCMDRHPNSIMPNMDKLASKGVFAKHALWQETTNAPLIISIPGNLKIDKCDSPVEMLDIYPNLVTLCGLPANHQNEGKSLKTLIQNPNSNSENYAITTYGRNNHAVVSGSYRYIHYEDGSEELYNRN
jgi:arylsulfatase A-like enzyme